MDRGTEYTHVIIITTTLMSLSEAKSHFSLFLLGEK